MSAIAPSQYDEGQIVSHELHGTCEVMEYPIYQRPRRLNGELQPAGWFYAIQKVTRSGKRTILVAEETLVAVSR